MPRSETEPYPRTPMRKLLRTPFTVLRLCLLLIFSGPMVLPGYADPSCGLEGWLDNLNTSANNYVKSLGTPQEHQAARQFRTEMERYSRSQLLKQIDAANLGGNERALMDFISSRLHLLELQKDDWPEMAARYGKDPRFSAQSRSLSSYIAGTPCDPQAPDFLNGNGNETQSLLERFNSGLNEIADIVTASTEEEAPKQQFADPKNFDEFRASMKATPQKTAKPPPVELSPSGNAAFVLGLFTFFTAISAWAWMRYGIVQRRATRYPCVLPTTVFDGIQPMTGMMLDISQIGCKIEIELNLQLRQKIKITSGTVTRKAKIVWRNNHFVGVRFDKTLTEVEIKSLLALYASQIDQARAEARQYGLSLPQHLAGKARAAREQAKSGADTDAPPQNDAEAPGERSSDERSSDAA